MVLEATLGPDDAMGVKRRQWIAFWMMLGLGAVWIAGGVMSMLSLRPLLPGFEDRRWAMLIWPLVNAGLMVWAAFALRRGSTGGQLLARIFVAGPLCTRFVHHGLEATFMPSELILLVPAAVVLLVLGRSGLQPDGGPFAPTRFRGLLLLMIMASGVLAYAAMTPIADMFVGQLHWPDEQVVRWGVQGRRALFFAAYAITAIGLYRMLAAVLLIPLGLGLYFLYLATALPYVPSPDSLSPAFVQQLRADGIRHGILVLLLVVPFFAGLARLHLRATSSSSR